MSTTVTVRGIDPADNAWLKREARQVGVSVEEFVLRLIREKRAKAERNASPSEVFKRYFGAENGVKLPESGHFVYRKVEFVGERET